MPVQSLGWGDSPEGGHGNPLQYSCLESAMDRGSLQATGHSVAKSWTWPKQLSRHVCTWYFLLIFFFWEISILFSTVAVLIYIPTNVVQGFPFLHIFPKFYYLYSFWWQPCWQASSDISLWFWFAFSWWLVMSSMFSCACWSPAYSLWKKKNVYLVLLSIFKLDFFFFLFSCVSHFCILDINHLTAIIVCILNKVTAPAIIPDI